MISERAVGVESAALGPPHRGGAGDFVGGSDRLAEPVDQWLCTPNACEDRVGAVQVSVGDRRADAAQGRRHLVQDGDDRFPDRSDRVCGQQRDDQDADRASDQGIKAPFQAATPAGGSRVATSTAELPACVAISSLPSSQTAIVIARATTSAICQAPLPMTDQEIGDPDADAHADDELDGTTHPPHAVQTDNRGYRSEERPLVADQIGRHRPGDPRGDRALRNR